MIIAKLGDSLAVQLDDEIVEALALKEGDEVEVAIRRPAPASRQSEGSLYDPTLDRDTWLQQMKRFEGMLPADFKFNRDEANER